MQEKQKLKEILLFYYYQARRSVKKSAGSCWQIFKVDQEAMQQEYDYTQFKRQ